MRLDAEDAVGVAQKSVFAECARADDTGLFRQGSDLVLVPRIQHDLFAIELVFRRPDRPASRKFFNSAAKCLRNNLMSETYAG